MLKASIIGNLGADAQVIRGNFEPFVSMSVAHTRTYNRADGTPIKETYWCNVVINWKCDNLLQYLVKGTKIYASGQLRTRIYIAHDGQKHAGVDIIADTVELCGSPKVETAAADSVDVEEGER